MKKDLSRRQFLHRTAGAAGALAASPAIFLEPEHIPLPLQSTAPSDRLRFGIIGIGMQRSEEHTSELQSRLHLVCRLLLENTNRTIAGRSPFNFSLRCSIPFVASSCLVATCLQRE